MSYRSFVRATMFLKHNCMVRVADSVGWDGFTMQYTQYTTIMQSFPSSLKYTLHIMSHLLPMKWNLCSKFVPALFYREQA